MLCVLAAQGDSGFFVHNSQPFCDIPSLEWFQAIPNGKSRFRGSKMKRFIIVLFTVTVILSSQAFGSIVLPNGGAALQGVFDGITLAPSSGSSSLNVNTDQMSDAADSFWLVTGSSSTVSTIVMELSGFASGNRFGIFDFSNSGNRQELFAGSNVAGDSVTLSIKASGEVFINSVGTGNFFGSPAFGYYLDSSGLGNGTTQVGALFFSDTSLNADGQDHMIAYQGQNIDTIVLPGNSPSLWTDNQFALAFEDLSSPTAANPSAVSDGDFTDFVVMVESVPPIPEPTSLILCWAGLIGLVGFVGRRRNRA